MVSTQDKLWPSLEKGITAMALDVSVSQQQAMLDYLELLIKWNKAFNLSGIKDPEKMVSLHLLDSLSILPYVDGETILDVGTGAGLPGIPLAICKPDVKLILLDSNGKKTRFLVNVVNSLSLSNVEVVNERIENFQSKQQIDIVLTRAFATLKQTLKWIDHLLSTQGSLLAMKGVYPEEELQELPEGFILNDSVSLSLPGEACERQLVRIARSGLS